jgi:hypothetical protein
MPSIGQLTLMWNTNDAPNYTYIADIEANLTESTSYRRLPFQGMIGHGPLSPSARFLRDTLTAPHRDHNPRPEEVATGLTIH